MARGASSRAASEFSSVRARAYPGIWAQKTKAAVDKIINKRGESFEDEKFLTNKAIGLISDSLKKEFPASVFMWTDVVKSKSNDPEYPFELQATFRVPGRGEVERRVGVAFATEEQAEIVSYHVSEGMDLNENGRPLNLRRDPNEAEEAKFLDQREREKATVVQLETFRRRNNVKQYDAWVKKTTERYYEEQRKANEERKARNQ